MNSTIGIYLPGELPGLLEHIEAGTLESDRRVSAGDDR
jgi:hypothetical protein